MIAKVDRAQVGIRAVLPGVSTLTLTTLVDRTQEVVIAVRVRLALVGAVEPVIDDAIAVVILSVADLRTRGAWNCITVPRLAIRANKHPLAAALADAGKAWGSRDAFVSERPGRHDGHKDQQTQGHTHGADGADHAQ